MEDTAWFESMQEYEKFSHLSELMYYTDEEDSKRKFQTLLSLVPVDLVITQNVSIRQPLKKEDYIRNY